MQVQEAPEIPAGGIPQPSGLHLLPGSLSAGPLGRPVPSSEDAEPRGEVTLWSSCCMDLWEWMFDGSVDGMLQSLGAVRGKSRWTSWAPCVCNSPYSLCGCKAAVNLN